MSEQSGTSEKNKDSCSQGSGKKPYRKPEFQYEQVFETMALACGKRNGSTCAHTGGIKS
jgi:hypothetical protein